MLANHRTSNFPKNDWEYEGWRFVFRRKNRGDGV